MTSRLRRRRTATFAALFAASGVAYACSSSNPPVLSSENPVDGGLGVIDAPSSVTDSPTSTTGNEDAGDAGTGSGDASTSPHVDAGHSDDAGFQFPDANGLPPFNDDAYIPCGIVNCSPGCCTQSGVCLPGNAANACGGNGNACTDCTAMPGNLTCDPTNWACVPSEDGGSDDSGGGNG